MPHRIEADLHLHSHYSDGMLSPSEVVARGVAAGLRAMSLTDHDTVAGVEEAMRAAPDGFEVVPGAEISSSHRDRPIHLLAYYIDHTDLALQEALRELREARRLRAERIVSRLSGLGIPITLEEVLEIARLGADPSGSSIGRPHIAEALVRHGAARDIDDAFTKYLRRGRPGHVPKTCLALKEAIDLVRRSGGVTVVAHPGLNLSDSGTRELARMGLVGIEAWHPKHSEGQQRAFDRMARQLGVIASGGSDYHGPGRSRHEIGSSGVGLETVGRLRRAARDPLESGESAGGGD